MDKNTATKAFAALGHEGRLDVFRLLMRFAPRPVRPTEIAETLGIKPNTLSGYLSDLADAGLVNAERSGRSVLYRAEISGAEGLVGYLVNDCCRGRPEVCLPQISGQIGTLDPVAEDRPYRVLFLCSANSARSIIAETLLRDLGEGRFDAFSAGVNAGDAPNPHVVDLLTRQGHDTSALTSKDITRFQGDDAPTFDFVFSVCDAAASEECAPWKGQPISAHWGMPDPAKVQGSDADKALAFASAYDTLRRRISSFAALPIETLDRLALQSEIDELSQN